MVYLVRTNNFFKNKSVDFNLGSGGFHYYINNREISRKIWRLVSSGSVTVTSCWVAVYTGHVLHRLLPADARLPWWVCFCMTRLAFTFLLSGGIKSSSVLFYGKKLNSDFCHALWLERIYQLLFSDSDTFISTNIVRLLEYFHNLFVVVMNM